MEHLTQQPLLVRVRERLFFELNRHLENNGMGKDYYCSDIIQHPMAEGRFLSLIGMLYDHEIISEIMARKYAEPSIERLDALALESNDGVAWGLGFQWNTTDANEPFVITTSLVVDGLLAINKLNNATKSSNLLNSATAWLIDAPNQFGSVVGEKFRVPFFSPTIKTSPINVVASWARTLLCESNGNKKEYADLLRWIVAQNTCGVGWVYDGINSRIDLLHQCYILDSISGVLIPSEASKLTLLMIRLFLSPAGFIDKVDLVDDKNASLMSGKKNVQIIRLLPNKHVVLYPTLARNWSIGDALHVVSQRSLNRSSYSEELYRYGTLLAHEIMRRYDSGEVPNRPRDTMHLCLGMGSFLCAKRILRTSS